MTNYTDETWNNIGVKARTTIIVACALIFFGCLLSVAGFLVSPLGEISGSVIGLFSQCLIWGGSGFGITMYVKTNGEGIVEALSNKLDDLKKNEKIDENE